MAQMETGYSGGMQGMPHSGNGRHATQHGRGRFGDRTSGARQKVISMMDEQKGSICAGLDHLAASLENMGGPQRQFTVTAADYVRRARSMLSNRSSEELMNTAMHELRARPGAVIAGAFALGFLGARMLRT
jgi:hypothetical protein